MRSVNIILMLYSLIFPCKVDVPFFCSEMNGKVISWVLGKHAGIYAYSGRINCRHGMYSYLEEVTISVTLDDLIFNSFEIMFLYDFTLYCYIPCIFKKLIE